MTHLPLLHQGAPGAPEAQVVLGCFHQAPPEKEVNNNEKEVNNNEKEVNNNEKEVNNNEKEVISET